MILFKFSKISLPLFCAQSARKTLLLENVVVNILLVIFFMNSNFIFSVFLFNKTFTFGFFASSDSKF